MRQNEFKPLFCDSLPEEKEEGILYISENFKVSIHLCACGCKRETVLPLEPGIGKRWSLAINDHRVSFLPSIGNFSGENPYHAHYCITDNKVVWC